MTAREDNPWTARFKGLDDPDTVRKLATVEVSPLTGLMSMPVEGAVKELEAALKAVFYPTEQCVAILLRLLGSALAHCEATYPSRVDFIAGVYGKKAPIPEFAFPVGLTGLAGIGKTELVRALIRVLKSETKIEIDADHSPFSLRGAWLATILARSTPRDVLSELAGREAKPSDLVNEIRSIAFRDGVPILVADEFQFATGSTGANTRVTQMLLSLGYVGIPYVYVANFSLISRLKKRPEEDRQRLLSDVLVLLPDPWDSEDWIATLRAQRSVAPDVLKFDPQKDAKDLHAFTAGRKRAMAWLIVIAYRAARRKGGVVDMEALRVAYRSSSYAQYREESESLASQAIRNKPDKKHKDLWCPIPLPERAAAQFQQAAEQARGEQVADASIRASLTGKERQIVKEIEKGIKKPGKKPGKVVPLKRRKDATADELKKNAQWFRGKL